jgi:hypothetical protein
MSLRRQRHKLPLKAAGPDSAPTFNFHKTLGCMWCDVTREVLRIWQGTRSAESINDKLLVLIPKFKIRLSYLSFGLSVYAKSFIRSPLKFCIITSS